MLCCNACAADYAPPWKEVTARQDEARTIRNRMFFWPLIVCASVVALLSLSIGLGVGLGLLPPAQVGTTAGATAPPFNGPTTFTADRSRDLFSRVTGVVVFQPFALTTCAPDDVDWLAFLTNRTVGNFNAFLVMNASMVGNCVAWSVNGTVDFGGDDISSGLRNLVRNSQESGLKICIAALVLNFVGVFVSYVVLVFVIKLPEAPLPSPRRVAVFPSCRKDEREGAPNEATMKQLATRTGDFEMM